jgi:hypothetical protein
VSCIIDLRADADRLLHGTQVIFGGGGGLSESGDETC